jgi:hypothetical protein
LLPFREAAQAATPTWTAAFEPVTAVMLPEEKAALTGLNELQVALRDMAGAIACELVRPWPRVRAGRPQALAQRAGVGALALRMGDREQPRCPDASAAAARARAARDRAGA